MLNATVSARNIGPECKKFVPNIFNKNKCSSCFRQKEEHSTEALECDRAMRKISKCGYLFVAPGWDFSNPLNRTKRWQRRWFVLYDDGELTYSVDEHPDTVPQARIDMTSVLEVAAAEDVTGHPYSFAVTSTEGVTFVKGTCHEETKWWADVLRVYSRNKGRHKRNATFPGGQTSILQVTPTIRSNTPDPLRPRFNSCRSESTTGNWIPDADIQKDLAFLSSAASANSNLMTTASKSVLSNGSSDCSSRLPLRTSTPLENGSGTDCTGSTIGLTDVSATEKQPMVSSENRYREQPARSASPPIRDKFRTDDKTRRRMNQEEGRVIENLAKEPADEACRRMFLEHERECEDKHRDITASVSQPRVRRIKSRTSEPTSDVVDAVNDAHEEKLIRGDPDGCGLDVFGVRYSPTSELMVDLPGKDLRNIKKGWLMKQSLNKVWNKHWFVLRGCGLMYYRDPCAEDKGIMDGVIDLNTVTAVVPLQVARNYGFHTIAWDERGTTVLSAVTAGIRSSWMSAIRRAANLSEPEDQLDSLSAGQDKQQDNSHSPTASITDRERDSVPVSTSATPRSVLFSSDEEYRTASEGGRRESGDWSEMLVSPPLVRSGDWPLALKTSIWPDSENHEWSELPPSPILTRTALSRVKARSRSSSSSRYSSRFNGWQSGEHRYERSILYLPHVICY